jgi:hypothetical protein
MGGGACHEALQHDAHLSEADKGVEVTDTRGGSITCAAEHPALDPRHLRNGLHRDDGGSRSSFLPLRRVRAPPASASCCQPAIAARAPGYGGTTSWPLPAAVSAPWAKSRRHVKSWFGATPWRRATKRTNHARLERLLDDPDFLRRCPAPTALNRRENLNSIRRIGHRHGCMPLAKCETGSGRFGGCLIKIAKLGRSRPGIQATSPIFDLYQI